MSGDKWVTLWGLISHDDGPETWADVLFITTPPTYYILHSEYSVGSSSNSHQAIKYQVEMHLWRNLHKVVKNSIQVPSCSMLNILIFQNEYRLSIYGNHYLLFSDISLTKCIHDIWYDRIHENLIIGLWQDHCLYRQRLKNSYSLVELVQICLCGSPKQSVWIISNNICPTC